MTSALGIHDPAELAKIARDVPDSVRHAASGCNTCLWAGCECRKGSMYERQDDPKRGRSVPCASWAYYD
jgi:hypothetical protein